MTDRKQDLATRQGALRERIALQRRTLAAQSEPLEQALARGDQVLKGVDWLKHHPVAVGAAVLAVTVARPKRAWRWAKRGFFAWRTWQGVRELLAKLA